MVAAGDFGSGGFAVGRLQFLKLFFGNLNPVRDAGVENKAQTEIVLLREPADALFQIIACADLKWRSLFHLSVVFIMTTTSVKEKKIEIVWILIHAAY